MTPVVEDLGSHYRRAHARIVELVAGLDAGELDRPVAACPGWSVADVVGHLTGVAEDALAGRLTGPPGPDQTAAEVARHRGRPLGDVLADWAAAVPSFADVVAAFSVLPAVLDVVSHEHDLRAALGRPAHRDDPSVVLGATALVESLDLGDVVVEAVFPDGTTVRSVGAATPALVLRATPFDVLRLRLGRRTVEEAAALDWSADPTAVLPRLFGFGPTPVPVGD